MRLSYAYSPELAALFRTERESFRHRRAAYAVRRTGERLVVDITAEDATALRAAANSVRRLAAVFEKARTFR